MCVFQFYYPYVYQLYSLAHLRVAVYLAFGTFDVRHENCLLGRLVRTLSTIIHIYSYNSFRFATNTSLEVAPHASGHVLTWWVTAPSKLVAMTCYDTKVCNVYIESLLLFTYVELHGTRAPH